MKPPYSIFLLALLITLASSCTCGGGKPDVRQARWGMSTEEVKKSETAELVNEGSGILTYRIGGFTDTVKTEGTAEVTVEGTDETRDVSVTVESVSAGPEYDLLYVFNGGKLGMAVVHLRDTFSDPEDYVTLLKEKSKEISDELGVPASGVAEYGDTPPKEDPYSSPGEICAGAYALRHVWPTAGGRTDVSIELDRKKFAQKPDCNLSIFYESVKLPVDPELSDELHDLL